MNVLEKDIQKGILDYLELSGIFCWTAKTTGTYDHYKRVFRKTNMMKGVPDIICIIDGRFVGFEVKSSTGRQSVEQEIFQERCEKELGFYRVVRSVDEVKASLQEWFPFSRIPAQSSNACSL